MGTVFYSWQADKTKATCRNFIQRALEDAIQRINLDMDVEESVRDSLDLDSDTKNVPGSPPVFETILSKIRGANVFVADLTFIGKRDDGRLISNPNVLIEYGYALSSLGEQRILAVMNCAYGEPNEKDIPFNLKGRRFPLRYELRDDATEDERKTTKKHLTKDLEVALRMVFDSPEYKASQKVSQPSALEIAAQYREDLDLKVQIEMLRSSSGAERVRLAAVGLLEKVASKLQEIEAAFSHGIEAAFESGNSMPLTVARLRGNVGFHIVWEPSQPGSTTEARLHVRWFQGRLSLPGEAIPTPYIQPKLTSEMFYEPTLSQDRELGWVKIMRSNNDPKFVSTEALAEMFAVEIVTMLRKTSR